jgi:hypothetical protein
MFGRLLMLLAGLSLSFAGFGMVAAFGVLAFIGMPLLFVGLGLVSASIDSRP